MYFTIYADLMLISGTVLNIIVLYTAGIFMSVKPRLLRVLTASVLSSIANILGYLYLYDKNILIQLLSYASVFTFTTFITYSFSTKNEMYIIIKSVIISGFLIGGILTILLRKPKSIPAYIAIIILSGLCIGLIFKSFKSDKDLNGYLHNVRIYYEGRCFEYTGFMDSGNMLKNPYTGSGVIIADKNVMKDFLPACFNEFIKNYLKDGYINYRELLRINSTQSILPITYSCINSKSETMPAIICDRVVIDNGARELKKISICFSRIGFGSRYSVLLSKDLI